jgi:hypothetical protein
MTNYEPMHCGAWAYFLRCVTFRYTVHTHIRYNCRIDSSFKREDTLFLEDLSCVTGITLPV